jgi:hypothetical protein
MVTSIHLGPPEVYLRTNRKTHRSRQVRSGGRLSPAMGVAPGGTGWCVCEIRAKIYLTTPMATRYRESDLGSPSIVDVLGGLYAPEDQIAMLVAYADASGHPASTPIVSVAALLASRRQWERFESGWRDVLADYGLKEFHMSEYESRRGPYRKLTVTQRVELIQRLIGVMALRIETWAFTSVKVADYTQWATNQENPLTPYLWGVTATATAVLQWADERGKCPLPFVFASGDQGWGEVQKVFRHLESGGLVDSAIFSRKGVAPLEAADLCAYEAYKHGLSAIVGGQYRRPNRKSFLMLLERKPPCFAGTLDGAGLQEWVERIKA